MTDEEAAIALVLNGKLTTDQLVQQHLTGALRPLPGQGERVLIIGSVQGYTDELATFHEDLAHELIRRGCAVLS